MTAPGTPTKRIRHHPELLVGGRRAWCNCACGWRSPIFHTKGSAHLAFGQHLLDAAFGDLAPTSGSADSWPTA